MRTEAPRRATWILPGYGQKRCSLVLHPAPDSCLRKAPPVRFAVATARARRITSPNRLRIGRASREQAASGRLLAHRALRVAPGERRSRPVVDCPDRPKPDAKPRSLGTYPVRQVSTF